MSLKVTWPIFKGVDAEVKLTSFVIRGVETEVLLASIGDELIDGFSTLGFLPLREDLGLYYNPDYREEISDEKGRRYIFKLRDFVADVLNVLPEGVTISADKQLYTNVKVDVYEYRDALIASLANASNESSPVAVDGSIQTASDDSQPASSVASTINAVANSEVVQTDNVLPTEVVPVAELISEDAEQGEFPSYLDTIKGVSSSVIDNSVDEFLFATGEVYSIDAAMLSLIKLSANATYSENQFDLLSVLAKSFADKFVVPTLSSTSSSILGNRPEPFVSVDQGRRYTSNSIQAAVQEANATGRSVLIPAPLRREGFNFTAMVAAVPEIGRAKVLSFVTGDKHAGLVLNNLVSNRISSEPINGSANAIVRRFGEAQAKDVLLLKVDGADSLNGLYEQFFKQLGSKLPAEFQSFKDINLKSMYSLFTNQPEYEGGYRGSEQRIEPSHSSIRLLPQEVAEGGYEAAVRAYWDAKAMAFAAKRFTSPKYSEEYSALFSTDIKTINDIKDDPRVLKLVNAFRESVVASLVSNLPVDLTGYGSLSENDLLAITKSFKNAEDEYASFVGSYLPEGYNVELGIGSSLSFIATMSDLSKAPASDVVNNEQFMVLEKVLNKIAETNSSAGAVESEEAEQDASVKHYRFYDESRIQRLATDVDLLREPINEGDTGIVVLKLTPDSEAGLSDKAVAFIKSIAVAHDVKAMATAGNSNNRELMVFIRSRQSANANRVDGSISALSSQFEEYKVPKHLLNIESASQLIRFMGFINQTEMSFPVDRDLLLKFIEDHFADEINQQVAYMPRSTLGKQVTEYMLPTNIAAAFNSAMDNLVSEVGDTGYYVMNSLGFNESQMELFDPGQIDTIAIIINNHDNNAASVLGNSTGTGKTRVMVATAYHAVRQGRTVNLVSLSRKLLESFVREAHTLGVWDAFSPLVLSNSTESTIISTPSGEEVKYLAGENELLTQAEVYRSLLPKWTKDPESIKGVEANLIFYTYNLLSSRPEIMADKDIINDPSYPASENKYRRDKVRVLADIIHELDRPLTIISDESHLQTGERSNTLYNKERLDAMLDNYNINKLDLFGSATWASNASKIGPYRPLFEGKLKPVVFERMVRAIGLPAQESTVETFARIGQYIRLELPKRNVVTNSLVDTKNEEFYTQVNDDVARIHEQIIAAKNVVAPALSQFKERVATEFVGRQLYDAAGNRLTVIGGGDERVSSGIGNLNFGSSITNFNRIFLIAQKIKTGFITEQIINRLEAGNAVFMPMELTGNSYIDRLIDRYNVPQFTSEEIISGAFENWKAELIDSLTGDARKRAEADLYFGLAPNTGSLLRDMFLNALSIDIVVESMKSGTSKLILQRVEPDEWIKVLVEQHLMSSVDASSFRNYINEIVEATYQLEPIEFSPFDQIKHDLKIAGYRAGEFSGRANQLTRTASGQYVPEIRDLTSPDQNDNARVEFQKGNLDCVIGGRGLFTGHDLHSTAASANNDTGDSRPRSTVFAESIMASVLGSQVGGRTNRIGSVGQTELLFLTSTDVTDITFAAKARNNMKSLNSLTGGNANADLGSDAFELISIVGAKAFENVFTTMPDLFETFDLNEDTYSTEGKKAATLESNVIKILNQMIALPTSKKVSIIKRVEQEYRNLMSEMAMDGIDPFRDKVMRIDARTDKIQLIRQGEEGNLFKGDVHAIQLTGEELVGQSIRFSQVQRDITVSIAKLERLVQNLPTENENDSVNASNYFAIYASKYQSLIERIMSSLDDNGKPDIKYSKAYDSISAIEMISTFLTEVQLGSVIASPEGKHGVIVDVDKSGGAQVFDSLDDLLVRDRFVDDLNWNVTVSFPGEQSNITMAFKAFIEQGLAVLPEEVISSEHKVAAQFREESKRKHGKVRVRLNALSGPMFRVTEVAMELARTQGQMIIGEPASVTMDDGSIQRIWVMPKSIGFNDIVNMPVKVSDEEGSKIVSFVASRLNGAAHFVSIASRPVDYDSKISRHKDVIIDIKKDGCTLSVPGKLNILCEQGIVKNVRLHELISLRSAMKSPFQRVDKKSHSMHAAFDLSDLPSVVKMLNAADIPLFLSTHDTSMYRNACASHSFDEGSELYVEANPIDTDAEREVEQELMELFSASTSKRKQIAKPKDSSIEEDDLVVDTLSV